jgi:hypothetical protein
MTLTLLNRMRAVHPTLWEKTAMSDVPLKIVAENATIGQAQHAALDTMTPDAQERQVRAIVSDQGFTHYVEARSELGAVLHSGLYQARVETDEDEDDPLYLGTLHFIDDTLVAVTLMFDMQGQGDFTPMKPWIAGGELDDGFAGERVYWIMDSSVQEGAPLGPYLSPEDAMSAYLLCWREAADQSTEF